MAESITMRAPTRIDFGGGWTDVPPYCDERGGFVCNLAIARYATATVTRGDLENESVNGELASSANDRAIANAAVRRFRLHDARVVIHSDFPIGAGLGGSSAAGVAAVAALAVARGVNMNPSAIAELSRDIEIRDLGIAGGRQDHYAAAYGGALGLRFSNERVEVRSITLNPRLRAEIERRCIIIYTGQSRISGDTITTVLDAYRRSDANVLAILDGMREIAKRMARALTIGNIDALGALVAQQWEQQRELHPAIPTPLIDEIIARAMAAGALGAKALGASGGGCVLAVASAERVEQVRAAIAPLGEILPYTIDIAGVDRCQ